MKYTVIFLLLFFFSYIGFDLLVSTIIKSDNNLTTKVVSFYDYETLKNEYNELLKYEVTNEETISKVILHDPYVFFDEVTILKGSDDGISIGSIVYNDIGFVGEVISVNKNSSVVSLVTNKDIQISVKVNNSYGILQKENDELVVKNITSKESINEGDIIYTSSLSKIGIEIPLGIVIKVESGTVTTLVIDPLIDINNLNYVFIRSVNE